MPTRAPRKPRLTDLPLVAYARTCGHTGRDYAVQKNDLVFCDTCQKQTRISRILAT